jgi:hypothetical protein
MTLPTAPAQGIHDHPQLKLGRRPADPARLQRALRMASFIDVGAVAQQALDHPGADDNYATFTAAGRVFGLYKNDAAGDCGPTMLGNGRRLASHLNGSYDEPTQDDVWRVYISQNPGFNPNGSESTNGPGSRYDGGVENQLMFDWVHKNGFGTTADGKPRQLLAYALVDHTNLDAIKAAIYKFDFIATGITLEVAQQDQTDEADPVWSYVHSGTWGGHDVLTAKFTGTAADDAECVTWAMFVGMADSFISKQVDEAWVLIWSDTYDRLTDTEKAALASEYQALTGKAFPAPQPAPPAPAPTPAPVPTPVPAPVADPADVALAAEARVFVSHHHVGENGRMAAATERWLKAKGFLS